MINKFYTTTFQRQTMVWTDESSGYVAATSFSGHIQQASPSFTQQVTEQFGKTFLIWCPVGTVVYVGDKLLINSGQYAGSYHVKEIQKNATGVNEHLELTVALIIE